jgi:hypothetical protein
LQVDTEPEGGKIVAGGNILVKTRLIVKAPLVIQEISKYIFSIKE